MFVNHIVVRMERIQATIVFAVFAVLLAAFPPVDAGAAKAVENCLAQTGTSKDDLMKFLKTGAANHNVQCALSCGLQAIKYMKADGSFDADHIKSTVPSFAASAVDTCIDKAKSGGGDICNIAYGYNKCFMSAEPKIYVEFVTT